MKWSGTVGFWQEKIWGCNRAQGEETLKSLKKHSKGFRVEREVKDKEGHRLYTYRSCHSLQR